VKAGESGKSGHLNGGEGKGVQGVCMDRPNGSMRGGGGRMNCSVLNTEGVYEIGELIKLLLHWAGKGRGLAGTEWWHSLWRDRLKKWVASEAMPNSANTARLSGRIVFPPTIPHGGRLHTRSEENFSNGRKKRKKGSQKVQRPYNGRKKASLLLGSGAEEGGGSKVKAKEEG